MKFTIIVSTTGTNENNIKRLFNSLENQTYKNFEVIVVSKSNHHIISSILKQFTFEFEHIHANCKETSKARNIGLKFVKGNIINFIDDECWFKDESLETVKMYMENYETDIATFRDYDPILKEYPRKFPINSIKGLKRKDILNLYYYNVFINTSKIKKFNIGFDERFGEGSKYDLGEDIIYLMDLYNLGYRNLCFFPETIIYKTISKKMILRTESFIPKAVLCKRLFGNIMGFLVFNIYALNNIGSVENFIRSYIDSTKEYFEFNL